MQELASIDDFSLWPASIIATMVHHIIAINAMSLYLGVGKEGES